MATFTPLRVLVEAKYARFDNAEHPRRYINTNEGENDSPKN